MPRGNDSENASRELQASGMTSSQWGGFANAEELIASQHAAFDPELNAALGKAVDEHATAKLDLNSIKVQTKGGVAVDAAVRGGRLVVVEEDSNGRLVKWSEPHGEQRGSAPARAKAQQSRPPEGQGLNGGPDDSNEDKDSDEAPSGVTVPVIREKLAELKIEEGDATLKNDLWALLPEDARAQLSS